MLKCFLFVIVIQINHAVEADQSKQFMLANYCTDYNTKVFLATYMQFTIHSRKKYIHDKEATEGKAEETLSGIFSTIRSFFIWHLKY